MNKRQIFDTMLYILSWNCYVTPKNPMNKFALVMGMNPGIRISQCCEISFSNPQSRYNKLSNFPCNYLQQTFAETNQKRPYTWISI